MDRVVEVFSGTTRPRHARAQRELQDLCGALGLYYTFKGATRASRIELRLTNVAKGYRAVRASHLQSSDVLLIHHGVHATHPRQIIEVDLPLGLHNYSERHFRRGRESMRNILESRNVVGIQLFSNWALEVFAAFYGDVVREKAHVIYPLAETQTRRQSVESREYTFAFVSSQFQLKGGPQLLQAFQEFQKSHDGSATLMMVTNLREANAILGHLEQRNVKWQDSTLNPREIQVILEKSKCLVHPSFSDSFGVVVMEAIAAGCVVIASAISSLPELVVDGVSGYLIDPPASPVSGTVPMPYYLDATRLTRLLSQRDLGAFSRTILGAMVAVFESQEQVVAMHEATSRLYESQFSPERWRERMDAMLKQALRT